MKLKTLTILACGLLLASCGSKSESNTTDTTTVDTGVFDTTATELVTSESEDAVAEEKSSSEDWDAVLDEYENYMDKTISLMKKAQAGDMSAMTEYTSLLESAERLQTKLDNAKDELTPAQAARLQKIAAKAASAAM